MKKALVLLMTVAMMLCFSATAFAANYSDMSNATDVVKNAVNKISALDIINGYEDGTYKPEATITRAEFAKIACIAAGLKDSGTALGNTTSTFSDVKSGEWYTGWISLANSKGFVKGYEDGTFKPNQTIAYQEVVTVLMRMLGYTDQLAGPWPIDYINQAAKLSVMDNVTFTGTAAATRGDVAVLVSNTLDCYMVEFNKDIDDFSEKTKPMQTATYSWVTNPDYVTEAEQKALTEDEKKALTDNQKSPFIQKSNGTSTVNRHYKLLEDSFDGYVLEDVQLTDWSVKSYSKQTFNIKAADTTMEATLNGTAYSVGQNLFSANGHIADVFYVKDGSVLIAKFVDVTSKSIDGEKLSYEGNKVKLDSKSYSMEGSLEAKTLVNAALANKANLYYTIKVNEDNEVFAISSDATSAGNDFRIVKEVNTSSEKVTFLGDTLGTNNTITFKDEDYVLVKDGAVAQFSDVAKNTVLRDRGSDVYEILETKTGKFESYSDTTVKIGGVKYSTLADTKATEGKLKLFDADYDSLSPLKDYIGSEVVFTVNSNNSVHVLITKDEGASSTLYGVITKLSLVGGDRGGDTTEIDTLTIFNGEGKTVKYNVKGGIAYIDDTEADDKDAILDTGAAVEYKLDSDGKIKSINLLAEKTDSDYIYKFDTTKSVDIDDDKNRITLENKNYTLSDKTVIINITNDGGSFDAEQLKLSDIMDGKDLEFDDVKNNKNVVIKPALLEAKIDGSKVVALVITEANANTADKYGIVKSINDVNSDGDCTVTFYGDSKEYVFADGKKHTNVKVDQLAKYTLSSGDVDTFVLVDKLAFNVGEKATDIDNDMITTEDKQYNLDKKVIVLEVKFTGDSADKTYDVKEITLGDLSSDDKLLVYPDNATDDATLVVRIVDKTTK